MHASVIFTLRRFFALINVSQILLREWWTNRIITARCPICPIVLSSSVFVVVPSFIILLIDVFQAVCLLFGRDMINKLKFKCHPRQWPKQHGISLKKSTLLLMDISDCHLTLWSCVNLSFPTIVPVSSIVNFDIMFIGASSASGKSFIFDRGIGKQYPSVTSCFMRSQSVNLEWVRSAHSVGGW